MPRTTDLYFIIAVAVIIAMGIFFTYMTAEAKDAEMREQLLTKARLAKAGIKAAQVAALAGADSDLSSPTYAALKDQMVRFHKATPDVRFTYLIGKRANGMYFFYVDSEPPDSPDYSPPGQDYPEATPPVREVYTTGIASVAGPQSDRWGTWVSGLVLVKNETTGTTVAMFGMDIDARNWNRDIIIACGMPVSVTMLFLVLLGGFFITHKRKVRENRILKESEMALQESERRLSQIINFLPDATFAIDKDGAVIAWNRAIEEMTGVPAEKMMGNGNYEYAIPFYGKRRPILIDLVFMPEEEIRRSYTAVTVEESGITGETIDAKPRGNDVVLWGRASTLRDTGGAVIGAIESIRDVTERRRLQESLDVANKKLNLLSSLTRHDILNKITVCLGLTAFMKAKTKDTVILDLLVKLEKAVSDIRSQVDFTKLYQNVGINAPAWQDVGAILSECHAPVLSPQILPGSIEIYADPMLPKVFDNLVENTLRHGERASRAIVRAHVNGDNLAIVYEDDGIGIPADEKERIFERGYGKNTGLGLFLAREILGITGITIRETGETGAGAQFEIIVPKGGYRFTIMGGDTSVN